MNIISNNKQLYEEKTMRVRILKELYMKLIELKEKINDKWSLNDVIQFLYEEYLNYDGEIDFTKKINKGASNEDADFESYRSYVLNVIK